MFVLGGVLERHHFFQGRAADHHAAGVGADVAHAPLDLPCPVNHLRKLGLSLVDLPKFRHFLQGLGNSDSHGQAGNELGDAIHLREIHSQNPAHIAQGCLGPQGAVGDDLGDVLAPILTRDIVQDLAPPRVGEVGINIGHLQAFA